MLIAVTPGDPKGIGPEIIIKAIKKKIERLTSSRFLIIGALDPFLKSKLPFCTLEEKDLDKSNLKNLHKGKLLILAAPTFSKKNIDGFQSGWSIEKAVELTSKKITSAIVTGPIHKEKLNLGGYPFPGHTEMLEKLCGLKQNSVTMMLANEHLRVSLVTTHVSLRSVSSKLNFKVIENTVSNTLKYLHNWCGIKKPKIAVMALNPHAGENGLFGREEVEIITPAIKKLQFKFIASAFITGPHSADTFFAKNHLSPKSKKYDAAICMYHDQALIPVKLLDFPRTVNITLGLPIIRTSVDHGVGFDIAGKNIADPSSFISAVKLASDLAKN